MMSTHSSEKSSSTHAPEAPRQPEHPPHGHTIDVVEHRVDSGFRSLHNLRRRHVNSAPEWQPPYPRPYRQYVGDLVQAGWSNLQGLDAYLAKEHAQSDSIISVLDMADGIDQTDLHTEQELQTFIASHPRRGVRLYLAEYNGTPSAALIETLGASQKLDPRFWQWSLDNQGHLFTPSQRHRAPYFSLGFGILNTTTVNRTDAYKFKVMVYVIPEKAGWTGIILFSSHIKINMAAQILTDPPSFGASLPPHASCEPKSLRELYINSLASLSATKRTPFYVVSPLLKLNCFCWNQIISAIRAEDHRIHGISDTTIGHGEEIKKTLDVVKRGGSMSWPREDDQGLLEDFQHLLEQTQLLWDTREKMAAVKEKNSEARWTTLTNAFTYFFAPVTIISGIYGMNVSQISGDSSNPNIWQFFVAVTIFNAVVLLVVSLSSWIKIQRKHGRTVSLQELLEICFGLRVGR